MDLYGNLAVVVCGRGIDKFCRIGKFKLSSLCLSGSRAEQGRGAVYFASCSAPWGACHGNQSKRQGRDRWGRPGTELFLFPAGNLRDSGVHAERRAQGGAGGRSGCTSGQGDDSGDRSGERGGAQSAGGQPVKQKLCDLRQPGLHEIPRHCPQYDYPVRETGRKHGPDRFQIGAI